MEKRCRKAYGCTQKTIIVKKFIVKIFKSFEVGSAIAVRLTKYTGKSKTFIHPKHFLSETPWYTKYLNKNDTVLDLGSGNGQTVIKCAKFVKNVVGIEIDRKLLQVSKESVRINKIKNASFKSANLEEKLNYKKNSFDKVILLDVLEHLIKRDQILNEIKKILKPKGLFILGVPNSETSWKKLQKSVGINYFADPDHKIEYSKKEIKKLLIMHRYKTVKISYGPIDTPMRPIYDMIGAFSTSVYKIISEKRLKKAQLFPENASGFEIVVQNIK